MWGYMELVINRVNASVIGGGRERERVKRDGD